MRVPAVNRPPTAIAVMGLSVVILAGLAGMAGIAKAQMSPSVVSPAVTRTVTQGITDAISEAVRQAVVPIMRIDRSRVANVNTLTLSDDARLMVSGLSDGSARVWDLHYGREIQRLNAHGGEVRAVAIDPAGETVATGGDDATIALWSAMTGTLKARMQGHAQPVRTVAFSADGGQAVSGAGDGLAILWDTATGQEIRRFERHQGAVTGVALTPAATRLLTAGTDRMVRVWTVATGEQVGVFQVHDDDVTGIDVSADSTILVTAGAGGQVRVWNLAEGTRIADIDTDAGRVNSVALSPDQSLIAVAGSDASVRVFDIESGNELERFDGHDQAVTLVTFGPTGERLHSASLDGTSRVWDRPRRRELVKAISSDDGWTVINEDGQFDGSEAGADVVQWEVEDESLKLAQFTESHFEPGLLARAVAGEPVAPPAGPKLTEAIHLPPKVEFISHEETEIDLDREVVEVAVGAFDQGGEVSDIRLYHNGKVIDDGGARMAVFEKADIGTQHVKTVTLSLVPGENIISAVGIGRDGVESRPVAVKFRLQAPERQSTLHVLTVGVNEYRNPALNLNYGVPDASAIAGFLSGQAKSLFKEVRTYELYNAEATRENILAKLGELRSANPEDVAVIYFAGHGETLDDGWYFLPHEVVYPEKEDEIRGKGLSAEMIKAEVTKVGAQKVLMLMDACKSGAALVSFRGFEERKALRQLARSTGIHIVAAAGSDQFAAEVKDIGHGVFTYAVLAGLGGQADGAPNDGVVSIRELLSYVEAEIPEISMKYKRQAQFPVVDSQGQNFPLVALN